MNGLVLGQTNIIITNENKIMLSVRGREVILLEGYGVTPNVKHFVFKHNYEKLGRNCGIYRARIVDGKVDFYFK